MGLRGFSVLGLHPWESLGPGIGGRYPSTPATRFVPDRPDLAQLLAREDAVMPGQFAACRTEPSTHVPLGIRHHK